jgi:hypothetical protein
MWFPCPKSDFLTPEIGDYCAESDLFRWDLRFFLQVGSTLFWSYYQDILSTQNLDEPGTPQPVSFWVAPRIFRTFCWFSGEFSSQQTCDDHCRKSRPRCLIFQDFPGQSFPVSISTRPFLLSVFHRLPYHSSCVHVVSLSHVSQLISKFKTHSWEFIRELEIFVSPHSENERLSTSSKVCQHSRRLCTASGPQFKLRRCLVPGIWHFHQYRA